MSCHTYISMTHMSHVRHMRLWYTTRGTRHMSLFAEYKCGTRHMSLFAEYKVSFAEYSLFYRALLQKRPVILRSLLIEATPYHMSCHVSHVVWHDSSTCRHDSYVVSCVYQWVNDSLISMSHWAWHVTHVSKSCHTCHKPCCTCPYGVATISRLFQIIGLFCRI